MTHDKTPTDRLPGTANLKARKLYRSIKGHFQEAKCPICSFYQQYGVLIIRGDCFEHLQDINGAPLAPTDIFKLKDARLIELDEISARQYRVTICEMVPTEVIA